MSGVNQIPFEVKTVDDVITDERRRMASPGVSQHIPHALAPAALPARLPRPSGPDKHPHPAGDGTPQTDPALVVPGTARTYGSTPVPRAPHVAATVSTSASISFISPSPPAVSKAVSAIDEGDEGVEAPKPRALLVDDTPSNTKMLRVLLQRQGLVCDEAENGAIAVEMVRTSIRECLLGAPAATGYSLVFMDCNMPVMDGLTAARIIRSELLFDGLMVGCTGNANDHEVEEFLEAGADFVMPKPLRYTELQRLLEYAESVDFTSIPNTQLQLTDAPRLTTGSAPAKRRGSTEAESGLQRLKAVPRVRTGGNA